jgi:hypothetical protein
VCRRHRQILADTLGFTARLLRKLVRGLQGVAPIEASRHFCVTATPLAVWRELSE